MALKDLIVKVGADVSSFKSGITDAIAAIGPFGPAIAAASAVGVAGLAAVGVAATKAAQEAIAFNREMSKVATLMPENAARVNELKTSVQDMAISVGKSTTDLADGMFQVISAFGDGADTVKILEINAKAAAAGFSTTTDAINLTSAVTKGYGDTSAEAVQKVADLAFKTNELGQTTFPELASSMGKVVPIAQAMSVSQEELFAVFATGTGVTGVAAEVATQFRGALQALQAPTADMSNLLEQLGVSSGKALVEQKGLKGALDDIVKGAEAADIPLAKLIGSVEGQIIALTIAGSQSDKYVSTLGEMNTAAGAADAAFQATTEGIAAAGFALDQADAAWEVFMQRVGDAVLIIVGPLIGAFAEIVKWLADNVQPAIGQFALAMEKVKEFVDPLVAAIREFGPPLVEFGSALLAIDAQVKAILPGFLNFGEILLAVARMLRDNIITALEQTSKVLDTFSGLIAALPGDILGMNKGIADMEKAAQGAASELVNTTASLDDTGTTSKWAQEQLAIAEATLKEMKEAAMAAGTGLKGLGKDTAAASKEMERAPKFIQLTRQELERIEKEARKVRPALQDVAAGVPVVETSMSNLQEQVKLSTQDLVELENTATAMDLSLAAAQANELEAAFDSLGVTSSQVRSEDLAQLRESLAAVEDAFRTGKVPVEDLRAAQEAYAKAAGKEGAAGATNELATSLEGIGGKISDIGQSFVDNLLAGNSPLQNAKSAFKDLAKTILDDLVKTAIGGLTSGLSKLTSFIPQINSLGGAFKSITGAIGSGGGGGGSVAGGVAKTLTGALGAVSGVLNTISGVVSAIGSAVGAVMTLRTNNLLFRVEENTRRATNFLGDRGDGGILGVLFGIKESIDFGTATKATEQIRDLLQGPLDFIVGNTDEMKTTLWDIRAAVTAMAAGVIIAGTAPGFSPPDAGAAVPAVTESTKAITEPIEEAGEELKRQLPPRARGIVEPVEEAAAEVERTLPPRARAIAEPVEEAALELETRLPPRARAMVEAVEAAAEEMRQLPSRARALAREAAPEPEPAPGPEANGEPRQLPSRARANAPDIVAAQEELTAEIKRLADLYARNPLAVLASGDNPLASLVTGGLTVSLAEDEMFDPVAIAREMERAAEAAEATTEAVGESGALVAVMKDVATIDEGMSGRLVEIGEDIGSMAPVTTDELPRIADENEETNNLLRAINLALGVIAGKLGEGGRRGIETGAATPGRNDVISTVMNEVARAMNRQQRMLGL